MLEKFKRELKKIIGIDVQEIGMMDDNFMLIPNPDAANRIERHVARMSMVGFAYYNPNKDGITFALK